MNYTGFLSLFSWCSFCFFIRITEQAAMYEQCLF
nr:MAG TPA: hypothetical protein [Caudoviricetes sp.]